MESSLNISDVYVFKKVAATLSFTKAARQVGVSRSAVSKQINRLEKALGVVLINRSTRSVNLTEAGRTFDARTAKIDTTIERAADLVRGADLSPLGTVSFTLPSALGATLMPALTTQFQEQWPELRLHVHFDDNVRDLIASNLDLAVRISKKLEDSSMISRRLCTTRKVFAASSRYLRKAGIPVKIADLKNHRCLGRGNGVGPGGRWRIQENGKILDLSMTLAISANNNLALILAACLDGGIVYVPEICIAGELARHQLQVIPNFVDPETYGIYALYPHRKAATKVKVLVDFIEEMLPTSASFNRLSPLAGPVVGNTSESVTRDTTHVA